MILVTGGTGFLGQRVVRRLVDQGCDRLRCLVRPGTDPASLDTLFSGLRDRCVLDFFPCSFNSLDDLRRALDGVGVVYHIAASKQGSFAAQTANTVVGTENLLMACQDIDLDRFVLVSSFSVIGVADLPRGAMIDESTPVEPHPEWRDPYAFAKQRQERLVLDYHARHGVPVVVVRPGVIYGPGAPVLSLRVGMTVFGLWLFLGGSNPVPLTYVDNCADAVIAAGTASGVVGEIFHICDDDLPTARRMMRLYGRRKGRGPAVPIPFWLLKLLARANVWYAEKSKGNLPILVSPYLVDTIWKRHRFSNAKAVRMIGWRPRISIQEGLKRTIEEEAGA